MSISFYLWIKKWISDTGSSDLTQEVVTLTQEVVTLTQEVVTLTQEVVTLTQKVVRSDTGSSDLPF